MCKSSRIRRKPNSGTVRRFSPLKPAFFFPNSAKAEFVGFGSRFLESHGFLGAKAGFLLLSARGWRTSRGIFCVVFFLFCSGGLGLAWEPGGAGILFFLPGFYGKAAFWGKIREASFCLSFCSPSLFFVFVFSMYLMFFFCYNFGVRGFLWTRFLSC